MSLFALKKMKQITSIFILLFFNLPFLNAQKITKKQTLVKSTTPLQTTPDINYEITSNIDSLSVSKETFEILKN